MSNSKFISAVIVTIAIVGAIVVFMPNKVVDTSDTATTTVENTATDTVNTIN